MKISKWKIQNHLIKNASNHVLNRFFKPFQTPSFYMRFRIKLLELYWFSFLGTRSHYAAPARLKLYVDQIGLKLKEICLLLPLSCWD